LHIHYLKHPDNVYRLVIGVLLSTVGVGNYHVEQLQIVHADFL
jgi:hypothetical protein